MKELQHVPFNVTGFDYASAGNNTFDDFHSVNGGEIKIEPILRQPSDKAEARGKSEKFLFKQREDNCRKESPVHAVENNPDTINSALPPAISNLFRLFVKNGEYVYARPNDIVMMESCDHLVKVYLAFNDKIKKTIRHSTLKDFLLQLPQDQFMRIGRFCAVNMQRLSGGNCKEQSFEFDFNISIKLKHTLSQSAFGNIGK